MEYAGFAKNRRCASLEEYLERFPDEYDAEIKAQSFSVPAINPQCRILISIPVYCEAEIYETLRNYTTNQTSTNGVAVDPSLFEINLLANSPNLDTPLDPVTISEVQRFQAEHPQYAVNLFQKQFDFEDRPKMGMIFKYITDICAVRSNNPEAIIRTSGADNLGLHPHLIAQTLKTFDLDPSIGALVNQYKYPQEVLEKCPLIHFIDAFTQASRRLSAKRGNCNDAFAFRSKLYAKVGGFSPEHFVAEDANLSRRITNTIKKTRGKFVRSNLLESLYNPRRLVASLMSGEASLSAYNHFGTPENEARVRRKQVNFALLPTDPILKHTKEQDTPFPPELAFTPINVSREVSTRFEFLVRVAFAQQFHRIKDPEIRKNQSLQVAEKLLQKAFFALGLKKTIYQIDSDLIQVEIGPDGNPRLRGTTDWETKLVTVTDISPIVSLMKKRKFKKHAAFVGSAKTASI